MELGSKLILYTDGFVETVNKNNSFFDFESAELYKTLIELEEMPVDLFMENLVKRLVIFRGDDNFEDDVCIICLQV